MPELPEVEVLVRHLGPLIVGRRIRDVHVPRAKSVRPDDPRDFVRHLEGTRIGGLSRRGKFLVFDMDPPELRLAGHLGMTGRMYLVARDAPLAKHAAVVLGLGRERLVFEDPRYFGRLSRDTRVLATLGPEPLADTFAPEELGRALAGSRQAIKVRLLDQAVVAGVGNIYASEALFAAGIAPSTPSGALGPKRVRRLWSALRAVLEEAIAFGSTVPLSWSGEASRDRLFYYGKAPDAADFYEERLRVYDRAGDPCRKCGTRIRRTVLGARGTFHCPRCQRV